jgi:hypothetical protein
MTGVCHQKILYSLSHLMDSVLFWIYSKHVTELLLLLRVYVPHRWVHCPAAKRYSGLGICSSIVRVNDGAMDSAAADDVDDDNDASTFR